MIGFYLTKIVLIKDEDNNYHYLDHDNHDGKYVAADDDDNNVDSEGNDKDKSNYNKNRYWLIIIKWW